MADIVILGGGFGGLECATRLRSALADEHSITLIDRRDRFTVGAAKLWDVVGLRSLAESSGSLDALRAKGIDFVQADVDSIDPDRRAVETGAGTYRGDYLVVALGAAFEPRDVQMLQPPAHNLYDPASIPAIRAALAELNAGRIAILVMGLPYKCPPAPYEAAFLIDHHLRETGRRDRVELDVYTVQPSPLPVAGAEASAKVAAALGERNINLHPEHQGATIRDGEVSFDNGVSAGFDLLLGVPKHVPPPVIAGSPLAGSQGWIAPDRPSLRTAFEGVYALGDCISLPNAVGEIPKAGVFAETQGRVVAGRIAAEIAGGPAPTFDGHGYCFLEFAAGEAAMIEGDFFADPQPAVALRGPDAGIFRDKEAFVAERLARWF